MFRLFLLFSVLHAVAQGAKAPTPWWEHSLRLTGESDAIRNQAIRRLRKIPDLDATLADALRGDKQALAIDTIVAMEKVDFLPALRQLAVTDPTGVTLLAVNHFVSAENAPQLSSWFRSLLQANPPSPVTLILLDTLGRIGALVPPAEIARQLGRADFEIADGVLTYVRLLVLNHRKSEYLALLSPLMKHPVYQIRLRGAYFIHELPPEWRQQVGEILDQCRDDRHPAVRAKCRGEKS